MNEVGMFGRGVLNKDEVISYLEGMVRRKTKHDDIVDFEFYVAMTFASDKLMDEVASMITGIKDEGEFEAAFKQRMNVYQDRFANAPARLRKSLIHYLGKRHGKLESFDDVPRLLDRLKK